MSCTPVLLDLGVTQKGFSLLQSHLPHTYCTKSNNQSTENKQYNVEPLPWGVSLCYIFCGGDKRNVVKHFLLTEQDREGEKQCMVVGNEY